MMRFGKIEIMPDFGKLGKRDMYAHSNTCHHRPFAVQRAQNEWLQSVVYGDNISIIRKEISG
jgi:hypothetical protein